MVQEARKTEVVLLHADITDQVVDCIVNSANKSLLSGSGVCGAIHRKAGKKLESECRMHGMCEPGDAVITKGYELPAKYVIHTVGPVYGGENGKESVLMRRCYESCLSLAEQHSMSSIAFPSISTGIHGFPIHEAAEIVVEILLAYLKRANKNSLKKIVIVVFSLDDLEEYSQVFRDKKLNYSSSL